MGRISDEDIARVRDATDLIAVVSERVVLKQKGRVFWGCCPFHGEKTPSFKVDPATQGWHCFGCGLGGDVFSYVSKLENTEFPDTVRMLAERAHVEIHEEAGGVPRGLKDRLYAALDETTRYYHRVLTGSRDAGPAKAREYLGKRGFGSEVSKEWSLGFAPGRGALVRHLTEAGFSGEEMVGANVALRSDDGRLKDRFYDRVMFPIRDIQGRVVGFGGRVIDKGEPKYLNTNDTPVFYKSGNMYGIDLAKAGITSSGTAVVVEGYTDVIALHSAGITNVVATLGTALTKQHIKLLGRFAKRIVYLFDGDEAGMRAADRATEFIDESITPEAGKSRVEVDVATIPGGQDPADLVAAGGPQALQDVLTAAVPLLRFSIDRRLSRWDLDRPEERSRALADAASVLAPVKTSLLADDYASYIADRLGVTTSVERVKQAIAAALAAPGRSSDDERGGVGQGASKAAEGDQVLSASAEAGQRASRELLALLVRNPSLRTEARLLLTDEPVVSMEQRELFSIIADAPSGEDAKTLMTRLEAIEPGITGDLAAVADDREPDPTRTFSLTRELITRLQELELERRIAVGKARLRIKESFKSPAEYDETFKEVSRLLRRLDALRRSVHDGGFITENEEQSG